MLLDLLLLPAGASALVLLLGRLRPHAGWGALALTLGLLLSSARSSGVPPFPAREALGWIFWGAPLFAALGLALGRARAPVAALAWLACSLGAARLLLTAPIAHRWEPGTALAWVLLSGGLGAALIGALGRAREEDARARSRTLLRAGVAGASGLALAATGSLKLGSLCFALGAALLPLAVASGRIPALAWGAGAPLGFALGGLLLAGALFSALPLASALALLCALLLTGLAERRPTLLLSLLPLGLGLALAR